MIAVSSSFSRIYCVSLTDQQRQAEYCEMPLRPRQLSGPGFVYLLIVPATRMDEEA